MSESQRELSWHEERLLSRFVDGECGVWGRWLAGRLLRRCARARCYLESLREVGDTARRWYDMQAFTRAERQESLWERVNRRIEEEQRASLYLGERVVWPSPRGRSFPLAWGISGAALVTACLVLFALPWWGRQRDVGGAGLYAKSAPIELWGRTGEIKMQPVSSHSQAVSELQRLPNAYSRRIELDWLHSNGQVSLIPDRGSRSPIIWVNQMQKENPGSRGLKGDDRGKIQFLNKHVVTALPVSSK